MHRFNYHRPVILQDAVALINNADDGKFLSGGQTLVPTMKLRLASPSDLVDLRYIDELRGIRIDSTRVRIGATTTHAEVAGSTQLQALCPALCDLAGLIGDAHVRHMGTLGGSLANNDPAADYPAAVLALNANIVTNQRTIDADKFFTELFATALGDDEIIIAIEFEAPVKSAYAKFPIPASRYAMVGVFVTKEAGGAARLAITGAGVDGVIRHTEMENALSKDWAESAIESCSVDEDTMLSDIHANASYRAHLVKVMAKRAIAAAS